MRLLPARRTHGCGATAPGTSDTEERKSRVDHEQQATKPVDANFMTLHHRFQLPAATAALGAGLVSAQLFMARLDLGPYLNQARCVPWSGVAMVVGSGLQRLVS